MGRIFQRFLTSYNFPRAVPVKQIFFLFNFSPNLAMLSILSNNCSFRQIGDFSPFWQPGGRQTDKLAKNAYLFGAQWII